MELLITSFGLSHKLPKLTPDRNDFYGMPPGSISYLMNNFMLDYSVLLLCEKIILDTGTYERLTAKLHNRLYDDIAEVTNALYDEGFIHLEDFRSLIAPNTVNLDEVLKNDLRKLEKWIRPLQESTKAWKAFMKEVGSYPIDGGITFFSTNATSFFMHKYDIGEELEIHEKAEVALRSPLMRLRKTYRDSLKQVLAEYLACVNTNLALADALDVGFYDWADFEPFYRAKSLSDVQLANPAQRKLEEVRRLFDVSFPELRINNAKGLIKILKDKRIRELRELIDSAVRGEVVFDKEYANRILFDVINIEQRLSRIRNIVSYATLPIGLLPIVGAIAPKIVEEVAGKLVETKLKKGYQWFYLINQFGNNI